MDIINVSPDYSFPSSALSEQASSSNQLTSRSINFDLEEDGDVEKILTEGARYSLTDADIWGIKQSLMSMCIGITDLHTLEMLKKIIFDMLDNSETFRKVVAVGRRNEHSLEHIKFKDQGNEISLPESNNGAVTINFNFTSVHYQAIPRSDEQINIPLAPGAGYEKLVEWRRQVICKIIHVLISCRDVPDFDRKAAVRTTKLPTELLAQKMLDEAGMSKADIEGNAERDNRCIPWLPEILSNVEITRPFLRGLSWLSKRVAPKESAINDGEDMLPESTTSNDRDEILKLRRELDIQIDKIRTFISDDQISTDQSQIDPDEGVKIATIEKVAKEIETMGSWCGEHGDIVPMLIPKIYPEVSLNIFDEQGAPLNEHASGQNMINLQLQNNHYTPKSEALHSRDVPLDGNCFYFSLLLEMNKQSPSLELIQNLRYEVANYIRSNPQEIVSFLITDAESLGNSKENKAEPKHRIVELFTMIKKFMPNHVILQFGPQIHNILTGYDFKFTPTVVVDLNHIEIYPQHNEIGYSIATGSDRVKAYILAVKQQGINIDFKNCRQPTYLLQKLIRAEIDIPYFLDTQGTIAFELGVTDKTTERVSAVMDGVEGFSLFAAQTLLLYMADFVNDKNFIHAVVGVLTIPELLYALVTPNNDRERTIWFGFSLGYIDVNWTPFNIPKIFSVQANLYIRHSEMITYSINTKKWNYSPLWKELIAYMYSNKDDLLNVIKMEQVEINLKIIEGNISKKTGTMIIGFLDMMTDIGNQIQNYKGLFGKETAENDSSSRQSQEVLSSV